MKESLQVNRITKHIAERYGCEPEHLWAKYPNYAVFRHPASQKWYALVMDVPRNKLGLPGDSTENIMDIKCSSLMIGSLLTEQGFLPAYHMNKNHWIAVLLNDFVPDETICSLLELGYDSVAPKRKRKSIPDK